MRKPVGCEANALRNLRALDRRTNPNCREEVNLPAVNRVLVQPPSRPKAICGSWFACARIETPACVST